MQIPAGCKLDIAFIEFKALRKPRGFFVVRLLDEAGQEYCQYVHVGFAFILAAKLKAATRRVLRMKRKMDKFKALVK